MASSLRNEMYIKSAELLGASKLHILFREILPNCLGPTFTKMTLDMGWVILNGATLSFVGLGQQPPIPSLGTMVADGAKYLPQQWWISIFPSLAIMVIVLGSFAIGALAGMVVMLPRCWRYKRAAAKMQVAAVQPEAESATDMAHSEPVSPTDLGRHMTDPSITIPYGQ